MPPVIPMPTDPETGSDVGLNAESLIGTLNDAYLTLEEEIKRGTVDETIKQPQVVLTLLSRLRTPTPSEVEHQERVVGADFASPLADTSVSLLAYNLRRLNEELLHPEIKDLTVQQFQVIKTKAAGERITNMIPNPNRSLDDSEVRKAYEYRLASKGDTFLYRFLAPTDAEIKEKGTNTLDVKHMKCIELAELITSAITSLEIPMAMRLKDGDRLAA